MTMGMGCQWDGATLALKSQQPVMYDTPFHHDFQNDFLFYTNKGNVYCKGLEVHRPSRKRPGPKEKQTKILLKVSFISAVTGAPSLVWLRDWSYWTKMLVEDWWSVVTPLCGGGSENLLTKLPVFQVSPSLQPSLFQTEYSSVPVLLPQAKCK